MDTLLYINTDTIHTLHEFMLHSKTMTYIVMALVLLAITGFWFFLSGRDDDDHKENHHV